MGPSETTRAGRTDEEPDDFAGLLRSLAGAVAAAPTLERQVDVVLTFGGRVPRARARRALTPRQRAVLEVLGGTGRADAACDADADLVLGVAASGRLVLEPAPVAARRAAVRYGGLRVPEASRRACEELAAREEAAGDPSSEVAAWVARVGCDGARAAARRVAAALDQTDPILVHVGDRSYGSGPGFEPEALASDGELASGAASALAALASRPVVTWRPEDRVLVHGLDLLLRAGLRGEELNGGIVSPSDVARVLDEVAVELAGADGRPGLPAGWPDDLDAKADALAALRRDVAARVTLYREVDGITLHKAPRAFPGHLAPLAPAELPDGVVAALRRHGVAVAGARTFDDVARELVRRTVPAAGPPTVDGAAALHPVEDVLCAFAQAATDELRSDIGMTRGIRDVLALARTIEEGRGDVAMAWPTAAFYCAVVGGARLAGAARGPVVPMAHAFRAISTRMRFNGWHYLPGYFDPAQRPPGRHAYTPPRMPDLTTWSELRHAGHRAVRVRYAIRAPGATRVHGRELPGLHDLRVMRCAGEPYDLADLRRAVVLVRTMGCVHQALADHVVATGTPFRVEAFTDRWYDEHVGGATASSRPVGARSGAPEAGDGSGGRSA